MGRELGAKVGMLVGRPVGAVGCTVGRWDNIQRDRKYEPHCKITDGEAFLTLVGECVRAAEGEGVG